MCGTLFLTMLGLLVAGSDSIRQWIAVFRDPWIVPNPENSPNLHGVVLTLHGDLRWIVSHLHSSSWRLDRQPTYCSAHYRGAVLHLLLVAWMIAAGLALQKKSVSVPPCSAKTLAAII
jgi:hypothetical protein